MWIEVAGTTETGAEARGGGHIIDGRGVAARLRRVKKFDATERSDAGQVGAGGAGAAAMGIREGQWRATRRACWRLLTTVAKHRRTKKEKGEIKKKRVIGGVIR